MRASIVFVAIVGVAATLLSPAGARVEASRIVDRTFLCETGFVGGLYRLDVNSQYSTSQGTSELTVYSSVTRTSTSRPSAHELVRPRDSSRALRADEGRSS